MYQGRIPGQADKESLVAMVKGYAGAYPECRKFAATGSRSFQEITRFVSDAVVAEDAWLIIVCAIS